MESKAKRKRSPNWDESEKALLRKILKPHLKITEDKNTDSNTNKEKKKAWNIVHKTFLEFNHRDRSVEELKQQWSCIKMFAKKNITEQIRAGNLTGDSTQLPTPEHSSEDLQLLKTLPFGFKEEHNDYDSNQNFDSPKTSMNTSPLNSDDDSCMTPDIQPTRLCRAIIQQQNSTKCTLNELMRSRNDEVLHFKQEDYEIKKQAFAKEEKFRDEEREWCREMMMLKKRKLQLQIEILEKTLNKTSN